MPGDSRPPFEKGNAIGAQARGGRPRKTPEVYAAEAWGAGGGTDAAPGGRPLQVIKQLFADATSTENKPVERTGAAREFLDRIVGKPTQAITGADGEPLIPAAAIIGRLSEADLATIVGIARTVASGPVDVGTGGSGVEPATEGMAPDSST